MGKNSGIIKHGDIEIEKVRKFYEWLQGKSCPECLHFESKLNMTEEQAFSVIYFLQEYLEILPDNYERCRECGEIFDMNNEGTNIREETIVVTEDLEEMYELYCDDCRPD